MGVENKNGAVLSVGNRRKKQYLEQEEEKNTGDGAETRKVAVLGARNKKGAALGKGAVAGNKNDALSIA